MELMFICKIWFTEISALLALHLVITRIGASYSPTDMQATNTLDK